MIISIDPGYSTGVVIADNINYTDRTYDLVNGFIVKFPNRSNFHNILKIRHDLDALVIEDFLLFEQKAKEQTGSRFEATKVIERVTVYAEQLGIADRIVMQAPSLRLSARGMPSEHWTQLCAYEYDTKQRRHLVAAYQHLRYYVFWQSNKLLLDN